MKKWIPTLCAQLLFVGGGMAENPPPVPDELNQLYQKLPTNMPTRLEAISGAFLGRPYILGALGEGPDATFDQFPLYRTDAFDCETYVTTVLAIALSNNGKDYQRCLTKIRYSQGKIDFLTRNHFTDLDWNKANQNQGILRDITASIQDEKGKPVAKIARALIDKPGWYQQLPKTIIRLKEANEEVQNQRWVLLKQKGATLPKNVAALSYIPLSVLFQGERINHYLFDQIPSGAILEIVRPNWLPSPTFGTHMNVSHLGFVFRKNNTLLFREASSSYHQVLDVPLIAYLNKVRTSPTIKGINIQVIVSNQAGQC